MLVRTMIGESASNLHVHTHSKLLTPHVRVAHSLLFHKKTDERFFKATPLTSSLQSADVTTTIVWARFSHSNLTATNDIPTSAGA